MSGPGYRLYESCFGKSGKEYSDHKHRFQALSNFIPFLVVFDLAYLREIGARQWQDCEDAYFISELLQYVAGQLHKLDQANTPLNER